MNKTIKISILLSLIVLFIFSISVEPVSLISRVKAQGGEIVVIEPDDGEYYPISLIREAKNYILLTTYLFTNERFQEALKEASARGVKIRVMVEEFVYGGGDGSRRSKMALNNYGITTRWANSPNNIPGRAYSLTHSKYIVVDGKSAYVSTGNFTLSTFKKNREFSIITRNEETVKEIEKIFEADWVRASYTPLEDNIVSTPEDFRKDVNALINSAKKSIVVYNQYISDLEMLNLLAKRKKDGIDVKVILSSLSDAQDAAIYLGVSCRYLETPYVHAKLVMVDEEKVFIGSQNFSTYGIDLNREIGLITSDKGIIQKVQETFNFDWPRAKLP